MMTFPSRCVSCKAGIREPLMIGGMEVDLCENCQPRPTGAKKVEGHYDDYHHEDEFVRRS
jgi:hypothetical protein